MAASVSISIHLLSLCIWHSAGGAGFTGCIEPNQAPSGLEIWLNLKKRNTSGIAAQPRCPSTPHCAPFVAWCLYFSQLSFPPSLFFMSFFVFCQRKRDKSHNMQLSEGNEKERGSIASAEIQSVTRKQATVCHQTFGILSGSSDKFHQGQPVKPCNFPPQALSASSLFLHLVELNTCEVRPGPLLVQKARVSPGPSVMVIGGVES